MTKIEERKKGTKSFLFDREVRCGHRNSFVVVLVVLVLVLVLVGILLSKIVVLSYFSGNTLFLWY